MDSGYWFHKIVADTFKDRLCKVPYGGIVLQHLA